MRVHVSSVFSTILSPPSLPTWWWLQLPRVLSLSPSGRQREAFKTIVSVPALASTAQVKPKLIPTTDLFVHSWNITEYLPCAGPQHLHLRV